MKPAFTLVIYILSSTVIHTSAVAEEWTQSQKIGVCTSISEMATDFMIGRQMGISMSELIQRLDEVDELDKITLKMIEIAYEQPKFSTPKDRDEAITEYRNQWMRECLASDERTISNLFK